MEDIGSNWRQQVNTVLAMQHNPTQWIVYCVYLVSTIIPPDVAYPASDALDEIISEQHALGYAYEE
jgi:hypothetical protein